MEKYGVQQSQDKSKTASKGAVCPSCGSVKLKVAASGTVLCPNCGTRPFEGRADAEKED